METIQPSCKSRHTANKYRDTSNTGENQLQQQQALRPPTSLPVKWQNSTAPVEFAMPTMGCSATGTWHL